MSCTILSVAYPFAPVRSDTAGGAEQVLLTLDRALVRRGYRSVVIAAEGSQVSGELVSAPVTEMLDDQFSCHGTEKLYSALIARCAVEKGVDLIHCHGFDFHRYLPETECPVLVTLHLPLSWYAPNAFSLQRQTLFFNCVSMNQYSSLISRIHSNYFCIENGIDLPSQEPSERRGNYAVALGRVCPEKKFHEAFDAARSAQIPLVLAGRVFPYKKHGEYYEAEVKKRVDNRRYRFIGPVDYGRKIKLLRHATCTLITSRAPETSSLVAMESLCCGTPVICYSSGALTEIVENGKNGFVVENWKEMAHAIKLVSNIDRRACYDFAVERFSAENMVKSYIKTYGYIIQSRREFFDNSAKAG